MQNIGQGVQNPFVPFRMKFPLTEKRPRITTRGLKKTSTLLECRFFFKKLNLIISSHSPCLGILIPVDYLGEIRKRVSECGGIFFSKIRLINIR